MFLNLAVTLCSFLFTSSVSCSERLCTPECYESLQLTQESLDHFTAHLANGPTDPLVVELQRWLSTDESYQRLCLKYVVGSVAIFGKADSYALDSIRKSCDGKETLHLLNVLDELAQKNDLDTAAQVVAEKVRCSRVFANLFKRLIKESWDVVEGLAVKSLKILQGDPMWSKTYYSLLRCLPIELQYEMIRTREMALEEMSNAYTGECDQSLREIFLLARCSRNPDIEVRECIADRFTFFRQYLADKSVLGGIEDPCPENIQTLTDDTLYHISRFMDVETLTLVMPMVCSSWRGLYRRILMHDTRIHNLYLVVLRYRKLNVIHRITPWKYFLRNEVDAQKYFGVCIEGGALGRVEPVRQLKRNLRGYLRAVVEGRTPLPRIGGCITQYDVFVKFFEQVCDFCETEKPFLSKPEFLTDEEYERAVYHFVYEKRWILPISHSLIDDNMPKLFSIIKEDVGLMVRLVDASFYSFDGASIALILCGQKSRVPEKLARLIFCRTDLFKGLVEPTVVPRREYYNFIVESGILPKVVMKYYGRIGTFIRFLIPLIISFKDNFGMVDMIEASMISEFGKLEYSKLQKIRQCLEKVSFEGLMEFKGRPTEDVQFFKGVMARCGLM